MPRAPLLPMLAAALLLAGPAGAQCLGPDGLAGSCWSPAAANLPAFPGFTHQGTAICWDACDPRAQVCTNVSLDPPVEVGCGRYTAGFFAAACQFGGLVGGTLSLDYTRTWVEVTPTQRRLQVYRFVIKGDLVPGAVALPPCAVPACLTSVGGQPSAFYYGHLDYAFDCDTGQVESALSLFHNCDAFVHDPGFSSRPGTYHPDRSYALVSPSTLANPFVAGNLAPSAGPLAAEAVRNVPTAAAVCLSEDRVSGQVSFAGAGCVCSFALNPKQTTARRVAGTGACVGPAGAATTFTSVSTLPAFPWLHHLSVALGCWTSDATYPGAECLWADEGAYLYRDACPSGGSSLQSFGELYYGVSTERGLTVVPSAASPVTQNFIDVASNASFALPGPIGAALAGSVSRTRNLIYLNMP